MSAPSLKIFLRPERRFVAEGRPTELVVLVRLLPSAAEASGKRLPVNLGVVLDRGKAMDGDAGREAIAALRAMVGRLEPDDRISLTVSGDMVDTVLPSQPVGDGRAILGALENLRFDGMSKLFPAWLMAAHEVARFHDRSQINRVLVVSGGMIHTSSQELTETKRAARGLFRRGVSTSTLGLGDRFGEAALLPLGMEGGGSSLLALDAPRSSGLLQTELEAMRTVYSEWATLRLDLEQAELVDVLNDLPRVADEKLSLPPLHSAVPLNVVLRLRLLPGAAGSEMTPLTVRIKTLDLQARQAVVHKKAMRVHVVSSALADSMEPDLGVQAHAARLEFARMHRKCIAKLDAGDLTGAQQLLDFSLARFQGLSGQSGGTLLTEDLMTMMRLRERVVDPTATARVRKAFAYLAAYAQRGAHSTPVENDRLRR